MQISLCISKLSRGWLTKLPVTVQMQGAIEKWYYYTDLNRMSMVGCSKDCLLVCVICPAMVPDSIC